MGNKELVKTTPSSDDPLQCLVASDYLIQTSNNSWVYGSVAVEGFDSRVHPKLI